MRTRLAQPVQNQLEIPETPQTVDNTQAGGEEVQGTAGRIVNENLPRAHPRLPNPNPRNSKSFYNLTFDTDFPTEDVQSSESQSCEGTVIELLPLQESKHDISLHDCSLHDISLQLVLM